MENVPFDRTSTIGADIFFLCFDRKKLIDKYTVYRRKAHQNNDTNILYCRYFVGALTGF